MHAHKQEETLTNKHNANLYAYDYVYLEQKNDWCWRRVEFVRVYN